MPREDGGLAGRSDTGGAEGARGELRLSQLGAAALLRPAAPTYRESFMRAVGARQDVDVRANECDSFIDPTDMAGRDRMDRGQNSTDPFDRSASSPLDRARSPSSSFNTFNDRNRSQSTPVRIRLMMPVELTSDIMDEVEKDKARRELVSRVHGQSQRRDERCDFLPRGTPARSSCRTTRSISNRSTAS